MATAGQQDEDLESVLGATPHEFESRILRQCSHRARCRRAPLFAVEPFDVLRPTRRSVGWARSGTCLVAPGRTSRCSPSPRPGLKIALGSILSRIEDVEGGRYVVVRRPSSGQGGLESRGGIAIPPRLPLRQV